MIFTKMLEYTYQYTNCILNPVKHTGLWEDAAGPSPRSAVVCRTGHRIFSSPTQACSICDSTRTDIHDVHLAEFLPIMSEEQASSATEAAQRQVRVQLTSKQEDIALPESTGPILVPTGKNAHAAREQFE